MNTTPYWLSIAIAVCLVAPPAQAKSHKAKVAASPTLSQPQPAKATESAENRNRGANANRLTVANRSNISRQGKISLSPLPVDIYLRRNEKPTVAFTTPCIMIEKATHGFPPFLAFETMMFRVIGNVNESNMLPARLEPVCV